MTEPSDHQHEFSETMVADTETGERVQGTPVEGVIVPRQDTGSSTLVLPEDLKDLAALFTEREPTPREVMGWVLGQDEMEERDPEEGAMAIVARILSAETAEDVLAISQVVHAQDILGMPISIHRIKWQRGELEGSANCYAVITATNLQDDEKITITCGGINVMTQLVKLGMIGEFPYRARITKATKPTKRGYLPLWLEPA